MVHVTVYVVQVKCTGAILETTLKTEKKTATYEEISYCLAGETI